MSLSQFNHLAADLAAAHIRPCVDNDLWVSQVVAGRPYASAAAAIAVGNAAAATWTAADVDQALAQHPRIGDKATGASQEAQFSRREQAATGIDSDTAEQLAAANRAYEARFGRVFLIRAAGRNATEILAELQRRLSNDPAAEVIEASDQLAQIAALRLEGLLSS